MPRDTSRFAMPQLRSTPVSTIDHVYSELKNALMAGEFAPGQPLPLEELAVAFGTSHMPVREALNRLSAAGVLESEPRKTTRVPVITADRLRSLLEVRLLNEKQAVMWAAERGARHDLKSIGDINSKLDQLDLSKKADIRKYLKLNQSFHFSVYSLCQNRTLMNTIEILWLQAGPVLSLRRSGDVMLPAHDDHAEILVQIGKGNGVAAAVALEHDIVKAHDEIFAILAETSGNGA